MSDSKQHIISGTFWNFFGTILKIIIGIGGSILFVRYLGEADYGISIYLFDTVLLLITVSSLGLGTFQAKEFPRLKKRKLFNQYKHLFFYNLKIRFFLLALLLIIAALYFVSSGSDSAGRLINYFGYFVCFAVLQLLLAAFRGPLQQEYQQRFLNLLATSFLLVRISLVFVVIWLDLGLKGFLLTEVVVEICQLIIVSLRFRKMVWIKIRNLKSEPLPGGIFPRALYFFAGDLSSKIFSKEFDVLMIGWMFRGDTFSAITFYSLSYLLVLRSFSFLGFGTANTATLLLTYSSDLLSSGRSHRLSSLLEKQIKLLVGFVIPLTLGGVLLGEELLVLMYGASFEGKGFVVRCLFLGYCIFSVTYITKPLIYALGLEKRLIKVRLSLVLAKIVLLLFLATGNSLERVVIVATIILVVLSIFEMWILYRKVPTFSFPKIYTLKIVCASVAMSVWVLGVDFVNVSQSISLLVSIIGGVVVYILGLFWLKPFSLEDCKLLEGSGLGGFFNPARFLSHFAH